MDKKAHHQWPKIQLQWVYGCSERMAIQLFLVELVNPLANQEALAKRMGSITLEEKDEEEALFIRKKGPLRS